LAYLKKIAYKNMKKRSAQIPLREFIYKQILRDISSGKIPAGEKLHELALAKRYKVSRTPIREALFQLEKEGFIKHRKNIGAIVEGIDSIQISQILDITALLESYATEIVARKIEKEDISYLKNLQDEMEVSAKKTEYEAYLDKNRKFHGFFIKKCGNRVLRQIIKDEDKRLRSMRGIGFTLPGHIDIAACPGYTRRWSVASYQGCRR